MLIRRIQLHLNRENCSMLILSILIYLIGARIPYWITKRKKSISQHEISLKQAIFEFSGMLTCLLLSIILTFGLTFSHEKQYLLNKDAIYGIQGNSFTSQLGFEDGDKILQINDEEIVKFSDINLLLLNSDVDPKIKIERNNSVKEMVINSVDVISAFVDSKNKTIGGVFMPKQFDQLTYTSESQGFSDVLKSYQSQYKFIRTIVPISQPDEKGMGGFFSIGQIKDIRGYLFLCSSLLLLIVFLQLLPLPGFDLGNSMLVIYQKVSKKEIDQQKLQRLRRIFQVVVIAILLTLLVRVYFF